MWFIENEENDIKENQYLLISLCIRGFIDYKFAFLFILDLKVTFIIIVI